MDAKNKPYKVISKEIVLEKFLEYMSMNWRNHANMNPKVIKHLRSTTPGTFGWVEFGDIGTTGAEAALGVTTNDNPDRVELKWNKSQQTASLSMTRLVTKYPALKVEKGYLRKLPVSLRTLEGVSFLVLDMKGSTVEPVVKHKKKSDSTGTAEQAKKQAAAGEESPKE